MIAEAAAGLTAIRHISDLTRGLKDLSDQTKINAAIIDIQTAALDLQKSIFELNRERDQLYAENQELRQKLSNSAEKSADLDRYELKDFGSQTFAYVPKDGHSGSEPNHCLCANCFGNGIKSILQFEHITSVKQNKFLCHTCGKETFLGTPQEWKSTKAAKMSDPLWDL